MEERTGTTPVVHHPSINNPCFAAVHEVLKALLKCLGLESSQQAGYPTSSGGQKLGSDGHAPDQYCLQDSSSATSQVADPLPSTTVKPDPPSKTDPAADPPASAQVESDPAPPAIQTGSGPQTN